MALQGFIDDSHSRKSPHFVLAGFIGSVDGWRAFSKAWQEELDRSPVMPYLKMNEMVRTRSGPYANWTPFDRQTRIDNFVRIIHDHALVRVDSRIKVADYEKYMRGKVPQELDDPYFLCFYQIITATLKFQIENHWNEPVDFFFDEQGKLGLEAARWWHLVKQVLKPHERLLGSAPTFRDDKKLLPLQAADLYAWLIRNELLENQAIQVFQRPEFISLNKMPRIEGNVEEAVLARGFFNLGQV